MPWNSSGTYILPVNSLSPDATAGTTIISADFDELTNDLQDALTLCIAKDGQSNPTADLPMATNKHTGVGDATALTDYASANQVVDNTLSYCATPSAVGTDDYVVSLPVNPVAYAAGNRFQFIPEVANTGACTVDFNAISSGAPKSIKLANGDDPLDGVIQADVPCDVMYDGTSFILMNPFSAAIATTTITTSSIGAGSLSSDDWAHGLGTDDIDFGCSVGASVDKQESILQAMGADDYAVTMWGAKANLDSFGQNSAVPSAGNIKFQIRNTDSSSQIFTIRAWARAR